MRLGFIDMSSEITQEPRPFFHHTWIELEMQTNSGFDEIPKLQVILSELKYRKSRKAVALYKRVADRIEYLSEKKVICFKWPSTAVCVDSGTALRLAHFDYEEGLLKFMGYAVGQKGAYRSRRIQVLDYVFNERVPKVQSYEYMSKWGEPKSARRLEKLADCLASFARNAKRRRFQDMEQAVLEWEEDLNYLKEKYYLGCFDFPWPSSAFF